MYMLSNVTTVVLHQIFIHSNVDFRSGPTPNYVQIFFSNFTQNDTMTHYPVPI